MHVTMKENEKGWIELFVTAELQHEDPKPFMAWQRGERPKPAEHVHVVNRPRQKTYQDCLPREEMSMMERVWKGLL